MRNWNSVPTGHSTHSLRKLRAYLWGIEIKRMVFVFLVSMVLRAYLWGIEIFPASSTESPACILRAYLWGIEIQEGKPGCALFYCIASLPMRNWKYFLFLSFLLPLLLRAYLWGIESLGNRWLFSYYLLELRAYLWGIERFALVFCFSLRHDCEPTYEELKFCASLRTLSASIHCEPTYEELKLNKRLEADESIRNCEPTYEELKLLSIDISERIITIASLPMRNWNLFALLPTPTP